MRICKPFIVGAVAVASLFAADPAERTASIYNGPRTKVSMYIWSDKLVYRAGETATFKWTVKANGDLYPYTIFAYAQNNQTGVKTYLTAAGSAATDVTDITGGTVATGFQPQRISDATKATVAALPIPDQPGMHTAVVELRDYTGGRVLKASYMKIGVVRGEQTLSGDVTADRTLSNDTLWRISGVVNVKGGATLTIEPGTFIFGQSTPPSLLLITREGKISANGTKSRPIIMTSAQPVGQRTQGDWGGLIMLGKAPINVGANTSGGICGAGGCNNAAGTFYVEGLVANENGLYGGSDPNHNCGSLKYVRVEFAGSILSPNNETNSFTFGGCGKGTVAEHLQASYGADDSFEWFGGNMDAKYLVGGLGRDDYADFQLGYTGRLQFGLFYQSPDQPGNRGIEGDNSEYNQAAEPYSNPTMYNMTFVGSGKVGYDEANSPGIFLRRGARGTFNNMLVTNFFSGATDINDAATNTQATAGNIKMNGNVMWKNNLGGPGTADTLAGNHSGATSAQTLTFLGSSNAANITVADPLLTRPFEFSDPDWMGLFGSPIFRAGWVTPPDDGFFDQSAKFVGGIGDDNWTEEWTNFLVELEIKP